MARGHGTAVALAIAIIAALATLGAAMITTYGGDSGSVGPGQPPPETGNSTTTQRPPSGQPLVDLDPVDGKALIDTSPRTVNGVERSRPVAFELGCYESPQAVTYQLGRQYSRFEAVVGQSDGSTEEDPVLFEVFADDVALFSSEVGIGEELPVGIDLAAAPQQGFRMTIQVSGHKNCDEEQVAVWSEAVLLP